MRSHLGIVIVVLAVCSGCGSGPNAHRVRADTNDAWDPLGTIHFVEHGRRGKGVLVDATAGFSNPFRADWARMLVPTPPTALAGPVWTGRSVGGGRARAIASLPVYGGVLAVHNAGDVFRKSFARPVVWVLGTDPLVLGLPAGNLKRAWPEYGMDGGRAGAAGRTDLPPLVYVRYAVGAELDQPLEALVVFGPDFWDREDALMQESTRVSVVTLPRPLRIDEALDAIAADDVARLGEMKVVPLRKDLPWRSGAPE